MNSGGGIGRNASALAVAGLVVAGFLLRWFGLGFLLPQSVPVDALVLFSQVEVARGHDGSSYGVQAHLYPQLLPNLVALLPSEGPGTARRADPARDDPAGPATLEDHLARARAPYLQVNLVIAILSLIAIPATYLLARRFLARPWALLAAAWMATSVLHLWFSQEGRPHGAAVSFNLLAVLAALRLRRKPVASSYVLVGIAIALAVGVLQSGIAVILPCAVAFLLRDRRGPRASPAFAIVPMLALAAAFVVFYPGLSPATGASQAHVGHVFEIQGSTIRWSGHEIHLGAFNGRGLSNIGAALVSYDPLLTALAAAGAVLGLVALARSRSTGEGGERAVRDDRLVVLSYALPYACVVALYGNSFQRFAIPLLPFLACLAAYAMRALASGLVRDGGWRRIAAIAGLLAILGIQAFAAAKLSWIRSRPDTATEAATWIRANARAGTDRIFLGPGFDLPLFSTRESLEASARVTTNPIQRWLPYQVASVPATAFPSERYDVEVLPMLRGVDKKRLLGDPDRYLEDLHADFVVIELQRAFDWSGPRLLHEALERKASLAARFSPDGVNRWQDLPIAHHGFDPLPSPVFWFRRILGARCTGSAIEIWRM